MDISFVSPLTLPPKLGGSVFDVIDGVVPASQSKKCAVDTTGCSKKNFTILRTQ